MSVKRRDLVQYLEDNGFYLLREGKNWIVITTNGFVKKNGEAVMRRGVSGVCACARKVAS